MRTVIVKSIALALLISLVSVRPAFAYVDPNVGGMLFQALAAGFAVLSGIALLFSRQIRTALARIRRARRGASDDDSQPDAAIRSQSAGSE